MTRLRSVSPSRRLVFQFVVVVARPTTRISYTTSTHLTILAPRTLLQSTPPPGHCVQSHCRPASGGPWMDAAENRPLNRRRGILAMGIKPPVTAASASWPPALHLPPPHPQAPKASLVEPWALFKVQFACKLEIELNRLANPITQKKKGYASPKYPALCYATAAGLQQARASQFRLPAVAKSGCGGADSRHKRVALQ